MGQCSKFNALFLFKFLFFLRTKIPQTGLELIRANNSLIRLKELSTVYEQWDTSVPRSIRPITDIEAIGVQLKPEIYIKWSIASVIVANDSYSWG